MVKCEGIIGSFKGGDIEIQCNCGEAGVTYLPIRNIKQNSCKAVEEQILLTFRRSLSLKVYVYHPYPYHEPPRPSHNPRTPHMNER